METQTDFPTTNATIQTNSAKNIQEDFHMPQGTAKVAVQIDIEENTQVDCCMTREVDEAAIQTDSMVTQVDEVQTEETLDYIPLVREVVIIKLKNELAKAQQELGRHKEEVLPLQVHQKL